jgi:4'-phosphopantetheinyl transferase
LTAARGPRVLEPAEGRWTPCRAVDALSAEALHIWRVPLADPLIAPSAAWLSDAEQERAARFHFERDRRRFLVSHRAMRWILGQYLAQAPASVAIASGFNGKPHLAEQPGNAAPAVSFNLTHGGEWALLAIAAGGAPVGIDIEPLRVVAEWRSIAGRLFTAAEAVALGALGPSQVARGFMACWCRKEAALKSTGVGLAGGVDEGQTARAVEVGLGPEDTDCRVPGPVRSVDVRIRSLDVAADCAAAWAAPAQLRAHTYALDVGVLNEI